MLIIQWVAIIGLAWLLRRPAKMIGLPPVIGEMITGFLLGPTLFGMLAPQTFSAFFSTENIHHISKLATIIVTTYCFVIGLEFDPHHLQGRGATMTLTALASAFLPAVIGFIAAGYIASYVTPETAMTFKLSVALCFSVTAFPVLLRILEDTGMGDKPVGIFSIGISAILELVVWTSLPIILAIAKASNAAQAGIAIIWVACFIVIWFTLVRKGLGWFWAKIPSDGVASWLFLAAVGITSAYLAERLGIHANFGAFLGGFVVPREVSFMLAKKIKPYCVFLLPIFFAATGLKTTLSFGGGGEIITLLGLAILAYMVKAFGTALAVKLTGSLDWNDATIVGHLMCAKGAIGFAIIETCLSAGLLDPHGYSMLAFVILANTVMAAWGALLQQRLVGSYHMTEIQPLHTLVYKEVDS